MTNEELLDDLKQFVSATVSQATAGLATKDDLAGLEATTNKRFDDVDERLNEIQNAVGAELEDHEQRLRRLEHRSA
jgi:TolA-binding protein